MNRYIILLFITFTCLTDVSAQADRQSIRSGNKLYRMQEYSKAEAEYRKAVAVNPDNPQALYNLGCALMMQQKDSAAVEEYQKAARVEKNAMRKAKIFHNVRIVKCLQKQYLHTKKVLEIIRMIMRLVIIWRYVRDSKKTVRINLNKTIRTINKTRIIRKNSKNKKLSKNKILSTSRSR